VIGFWSKSVAKLRSFFNSAKCLFVFFQNSIDIYVKRVKLLMEIRG